MEVGGPSQPPMDRLCRVVVEEIQQVMSRWTQVRPEVVQRSRGLGRSVRWIGSKDMGSKCGGMRSVCPRNGKLRLRRWFEVE